MTTLNLADQAALATAIQTRIVQLRNAMELRKPIWDKVSLDKKKLWVKSGKDPIMSLAWNTFKYLRDNFFQVQEDLDSDG